MRLLVPGILLMAGLVAAESCAPRRGTGALTAADTVPALTIERGACYGRCPIYRLALFEDGRAVFTGVQFTRVTGTDTAHVPRDAVDALRRAFQVRGYQKLPATITSGSALCGPYAADLPTVKLGVRSGDATHHVEYDGGCMDHPRWLDTLSAMVDSVAGTSRWTTP